MSYVDGFVAAVPTSRREEFRQHCETCSHILKECGALKIVECWGDDVPEGKLTSFPMAVKREPGETVVFSWVIWPDKATRDAGIALMMNDPRMSPEINPMPFDGKRMIWGGFEVLFES